RLRSFLHYTHWGHNSRRSGRTRGIVPRSYPQSVHKSTHTLERVLHRLPSAPSTARLERGAARRLPWLRTASLITMAGDSRTWGSQSRLHVGGGPSVGHGRAAGAGGRGGGGARRPVRAHATAGRRGRAERAGRHAALQGRDRRRGGDRASSGFL